MHCVSSLAFFSSILTGKLDGKIRNVVASQVGATPKGTFSNKIKPTGCLPGLFTTYTDKNTTLDGRIFNSIAETYADMTTASDENCSSEICHR